MPSVPAPSGAVQGKTMLEQSQRSDTSCGPAARVDRRVVMKAAAALAAMAVGGTGLRPRPARAAETRAMTWIEDEHPEITASPEDGSRVFAADFPFTAVGPTWSSDAGDGVLVEVWLSVDGVDWGESVVVGEAHADVSLPDPEGRRFGALVFADGARFVRYRGIDGAGDSLPIAGLAFACIDSSVGPGWAEGVGGPGGEPSAEQPPIITRAAWGANESYRFDREGTERWTPRYQTVEHVIIHHTATPNFQDPFVAVRAIYYYHAVERRWGDIGYNYLVDHLGNVYEGRFGGANVVGGHAYQYAKGSSGIGVLGDFSADATTVEAQAGLVWITAWVARYLDPYGVADFHETPSLPTICAHRDVDDSSCPGDVLYGQLDVIRDLVAAVLGGEQPLLAAGFAIGDSVMVAIDDANLRSGPGTDFDALTTLPAGMVLTITEGPAAGGENAWYAVTGEAGDGWCAAYVLSPLEPATPSSGLFAAGEEVAVGTDALNLRDDVSLEASVIAVLPQGTEGTVLEGPLAADGEEWYLLDTALGAGWAVGSYLVRLGSSNWFDVGQSVSVVDGSLHLRDAPGLSSTVVDTMPDGTTLTVVGAPEAADGSAWYPVVTAADTEGWCVGEFLVAT